MPPALELYIREYITTRTYKFAVLINPLPPLSLPLTASARQSSYRNYDNVIVSQLAATTQHVAEWRIYALSIHSFTIPL